MARTTLFTSEITKIVVGGEVVRPSVPAFLLWILLFLALATVVAVPFLARRILIRIRRP